MANGCLQTTELCSAAHRPSFTVFAAVLQWKCSCDCRFFSHRTDAVGSYGMGAGAACTPVIIHAGESWGCLRLPASPLLLSPTVRTELYWLRSCLMVLLPQRADLYQFFCPFPCSFFISCLSPFIKRKQLIVTRTLLFFPCALYSVIKNGFFFPVFGFVKPSSVLEASWEADFQTAKVYSGSYADTMYQITESISKNNTSYRKLVGHFPELEKSVTLFYFFRYSSRIFP